jgi:glycosyltransferase involved in cell wall biosynthesis
MIIIDHSTFDARSIEAHLGAPDYSYWFVRKAFRRVLERFGIVVPASDPATDVDRIARNAAAHEMGSVFFSFAPPHATTLGLQCPTVPVFAWEFDTLPDEPWQGEPRNDWRFVLERVPAAITHSQFAATVVRKALGDAYPVWSIPAPVYEAGVKRLASAKGWRSPTTLTISGLVIDAGAVDLSLFEVRTAATSGANALKAVRERLRAPERKPFTVTLEGVVYAAVFNPVDARKNWMALLAGFIYAFRDNPEATLLLKVTHYDAVLGILPILSDLARHKPFRCRVLVIHGLLPDDEYQALVDVTSYVVNASTGEGQCLPLMEFMSAGRPAIAPLHTAMLDYVSAENSFVISSTMRPSSWPHDPRKAMRCMEYAPSFGDLVNAYRASFEVAKNEPQRYSAMSAEATTALQRFCSDTVVTSRLAELLRHIGSKKTVDRLGRASVLA